MENVEFCYRGYSIEDLAEKLILETSFLLIFGELPTAIELKQFEIDIRKYTLVNEEMKASLMVFLEHSPSYGSFGCFD
jgi:citrate synthase